MSIASSENGARVASPHTAVLISNLRKMTDRKTGLIHAAEGGVWGAPPVVGVTGITSVLTMRLGAEQPFYEVAFLGKVYRMLARELPGQNHVIRKTGAHYEVIRSVAPGLQSDGDLLEAPHFAPNTPRSLITELTLVTGAEISDLLENAYSIYHYRLDHNAVYPGSMEPSGYTLEKLFLLSTEGEGGLSTRYETPQGTNIELWTCFLTILDAGTLQEKLVEYVNSRMAIREFGEQGYAAMREAVKLRFGAETLKPNSIFRPFFDVFPYSNNSLVGKMERRVGRGAYLM